MMNYAQVLEQIEQLKIGKKIIVADEIPTEILSKRIIYIPEGYFYDFVGEYAEAILKEHRFSVVRLTSYAIKRPQGHILYNGKSISQKDFAKYGEKTLKRTDFMEAITKTEAVLDIAYQLILDKNVDFLILPSEEMADFELYKEKYLNCSVALIKEAMKELVISFLKREGVILNEKLIERALKKVKSEGHFELLKKKPYFIADGADDANSVKLLIGQLQYFYPNNPYIFIVGAMKGGYEGIVKESAMMAQQIITVTPIECRNGLASIELAQEFRKLNPNITSVSSIEEALEISTMIADKETVVVAFGTTAIIEAYRNAVLKGMPDR